MYDLIAIVAGYLVGAIPFGYLIPRIFGAGDIRQVGSGNVGATNAYRAAGPVAGILVLIFDIGKGVAAVMLARLISNTNLPPEYLVLAVGMAAILGHIFTLFLSFKGGKGVNTALGVMIMILPLEVIAAIIIFIVTVSISKYISLGSILGAVTLFLAVLAETIFDIRKIPSAYLVTTLLLLILIIFAHRSNIKRIFDGRENRFSFHSRTAGDVEVKENV
jgi:glycerol-3-phosphate acyltransferase PlsY